MDKMKPLFIINESVRHMLGPERSVFLEYFEVAQYSSNSLRKKVKKFICNDIPKIKKYLIFDADIIKEWTKLFNPECDEYKIKIRQFLCYYASMGYYSTHFYIFGDKNLIAPTEFIASYISAKIYFSKIENTILWLRENKIKRDNSETIALTAESIVKDVHELIPIKLPNDNGMPNCFESKSPGQKYGDSVSKLSRQKDNIAFWHREFAKRKFYLDVKNNKYLENNVNAIIDFASFTTNNYNINIEQCTSCRFINKELFWESFYSPHKNFVKCLSCDCKVVSVLANNSFQILNDNGNNYKEDDSCRAILLGIHKEYGYFFTDLCTRCDSDWIANAKKRYGYLPHYITHEENIHKRKISIDDILFDIESDPDVIYRSIIAGDKKRKIKCTNLNKNGENKNSNRYIENTESYIVGIWLWDRVNIFDNRIENKCTAEDIRTLVTNTDWYKDFNVYQNYKKDIVSYVKGEHGSCILLRPIIAEHRRDYHRVHESIRVGILLSLDEANKRKYSSKIITG